VFATWPATRTTLTLLEFVQGDLEPTLTGGLLLSVLDPADELVAGKRCDVLPRPLCRWMGDQCAAQVQWQLMHHTTGNTRGDVKASVARRHCTSPRSWRR